MFFFVGALSYILIISNFKDWNKVLALIGDTSLFSTNPVIKSLIIPDTKTSPYHEAEPWIIQTKGSEIDEATIASFEKSLRTLMRRIPFINKWPKMDLKDIMDYFPNQSQRQSLDLLYAAHLITNMLIYKNKCMISQYLKTLEPILPKIPAIHQLVHFVSESYEINVREDKVDFKFKYIPTVPLVRSLPFDSLQPLAESCEELMNYSQVIIKDDLEVVDRMKEIDHIYLYLQNKLGVFLTKYCRNQIKFYRENIPFTHKILSRRFKLKKSLRNVLAAEIYMKSRHLMSSIQNPVSKTNFNPKCLSNDAILTYCLANRKNKNLGISESLYARLCEIKTTDYTPIYGTILPFAMTGHNVFGKTHVFSPDRTMLSNE
ncbi:hypothetical protein RF11_05214 [Thelohanellus kitauei]|uniref:Uncharacterized protein n=1 Tax=Thelohanellus kitauei TaxID=669202 RepID=A0A0C2J0J8_THEKT|nr:hypothetical protein RF11_05214 [Thelohanellus kitauei]